MTHLTVGFVRLQYDTIDLKDSCTAQAKYDHAILGFEDIK